ncbi:sulfur oxidation c-type cytochrome SoxA [Pseudomonadota bacterium]
MIKQIIACVIFLPTLLANQAAYAGPPEDRESFVAFFKTRFPDISFAEYANGIYAIDQDAREQWQEIEVFPPYEFSIDQGKSLWDEKFADGKTYSDCFKDSESGVKQLFPKFDKHKGEVVTLAMAINRCREKHGQTGFEYGGDQLLSLSAYMAFQSRGNTINVTVTKDDPRAMAAYEEGKQFYYTKRGQLNFSCADCHISSAGQYVRADRLSAGLGHPTHFPVYRSKSGGMVSLHQRFYGCVRDVRAKPFELQSREFRNLEYFLTYMSNGLEVNGPGARK